MSLIDPTRFDTTAAFAPYEPLRSRWLSGDALAWIEDADRIAQQRDLRTHAGAALRFRAADQPPASALDWERRIHAHGVVACRTDPAGNAHDLHNALVWLAFPRLRAAINHAHVLAGGRQADDSHRAGSREGRDPGRGILRDRLSLLDENGLLWIAPSAQLASIRAHLVAHDWPALLAERPSQRVDRERFIVVGHGLLEKLRRPYAGVTAHAMLVGVDEDERQHERQHEHEHEHEHEHAPRHADLLAAAQIRPTSELTLHPLPLMGIPGWHPDNVDARFLEDVSVFRPAVVRPARRPSREPH